MAELAISRFFETPLIRQAFDGDFVGLSSAVVEHKPELPRDGTWAPIDLVNLGAAGEALIPHVVTLAERFSVDAHARPPRHAWGLALAARIVPPGVVIAPIWDAGAYWQAIIRLAGEADLVIEDPRMPMRVMHEPDLVLRAPDNVPDEEARVGTRLTPGEVVLMPGWLRCGLQNDGNTHVIELGLSLFARPASTGS